MNQQAFPIAQGMLPWQPISGLKMDEIGRRTFSRRLGIPKRSGISQFRFQKVHLRWSGYIVKNLVNLWSSNSGV